MHSLIHDPHSSCIDHPCIDHPLCRGALKYDQQVERPVRQGNDIALVSVVADVCTQCNELLLHPGMADRLVLAARSLREGNADHVVGRVFDLRSSTP